MLIIQSYKFLLKVPKTRERELFQIIGCCRFVSNKICEANRKRLESGEPLMRQKEMSKYLTALRADHEFLQIPARSIIQDVTYNQDQAWNDYVKKSARMSPEERSEKPYKFVPKFKSRGDDASFYLQAGRFKLSQDSLKIPNVDSCFHFKKHREVEGTPKNVTVSYKNGKWYIAIQTEREVEEPIHSSSQKVGVDMGIVNFATLSDGTFVPPINALAKHQQRMGLLQQRMSRKVKGSKNWIKQKARVAKLHERIANIRKDHLHKASHKITRDYQFVAMEDLKVSNMMRSARGTVESPGKNVRVKAGLNRAISDQGWYMFRTQVEYKSKWRGASFVKVDPKRTSTTCPACGHSDKKNRVSQAEFVCVKCGHNEHADIVGAQNVLRRGLQKVAIGTVYSQTTRSLVEAK